MRSPNEPTDDTFGYACLTGYYRYVLKRPMLQYRLKQAGVYDSKYEQEVLRELVEKNNAHLLTNSPTIRET